MIAIYLLYAIAAVSFAVVIGVVLHPDRKILPGVWGWASWAFASIIMGLCWPGVILMVVLDLLQEDRDSLED